MVRFCTKCKKELGIEFFNFKNDKHRPKDLRRSDCKACQRITNIKWKQSESGILYGEKSKNDGRNHIAYKKYYNSEKGKIWSLNGRKRRTASGRGKAYDAVKYTLKIGKLSKNNVCSICNKEGSTEFHHHAGYSFENKLNVTEICRQCHGKEHANANL